ncbi:MAG: hypothetical protein IMZ66_02765, partial [Planctomycetes bacterium]|nr:hypothetical protein [Planctomycetota bacterium]
MRTLLVGLLAGAMVALGLGVGAPVYGAGEDYWQGNPLGVADWSTDANWTLGRDPLDTDNASVDNGGTAEIATAWPAANDLYVGRTASGIITQQPASETFNVKRHLYLGYNVGAIGTYNLVGGTLCQTWNAYATAYVGYAGQGFFNFTSGNHYITDSLQVGYLSGATGTYTQAGGTLTAGHEFIGSSGTGTFEQTGGTHGRSFNVSPGAPDDCHIGYLAGSSGTYHQTGGTFLGHSVYVGDYGTGVFRQEGGSTQIHDYLYVGWEAGSHGTYELSGATTTLSAASEYIAYKGEAHFIQTSGTHTATSYVTMAYETGSVATYELRGGTFSAWSTSLGYRGTATFLQTGGTHKTKLRVGPTSTYRLTDGQLTANGTTVVYGKMIQEGGTCTLNNSMSLLGTYTLAGGTLTGGEIDFFTGGRFAAGSGNVASNTNLSFTGSATVDVAAGGTFTSSGTFTESSNNLTCTKTGGGTFVVGGTQTHKTGAVLAVNEGTVRLDTDAGSASVRTLTINADGGGAVRFGTTQHLVALNLTTGSAGFVAGVDGTLVAGALAVDAADSRLDLGAGNLIIDYAAGGASPLTTIAGYVRSGYNAPAGYWDGNGITSGAAAGDTALLTAVGVIPNTDPLVGGKATFEGQTVDASSVLVKYTYWGDANFDGAVTFDDYDIID